MIGPDMTPFETLLLVAAGACGGYIVTTCIGYVMRQLRK